MQSLTESMFWPTQYYLPIAKLFSNTGNLEMYHRYCTGNYLSRPLTKTFTAAAFTNAKLEISSMFKSSQLHPHPRQIWTCIWSLQLWRKSEKKTVGYHLYGKTGKLTELTWERQSRVVVTRSQVGGGNGKIPVRGYKLPLIRLTILGI